jgi:hypothetical protein
MTSLALSTAIAELRSRNARLVAVYRESARSLPPGPVSRLAQSVAEQRLDLEKSLVQTASELGSSAAGVEFEIAPGEAAGSGAAAAALTDPQALLRLMAAAEEAEHDLLAALAGSILPASSAIAESLAAEADAARKRSAWAQDQLELLSMLR